MNHLQDETFNGLDQADRIHMHMSPRGTQEELHRYLLDDFGAKLGADDSVRKARLHLCSPFVNDGHHPPLPSAAHWATRALPAAT